MAARLKASPLDTIRTQTGPFVMTPVWVLERCKDARAIQLYAHLMKFANGEGRAWPTRQQLRALLDCSERSLARAITALKDIQALEVRLKHRADGAVVGADYVLLQVMPERGVQNATSGIKATSATPTLMPPAPTLMPPVAAVLKEELDPDNQIQVQDQQQPASTGDPAAADPTPGTVFGGYEFDPTKPADGFALLWNELIADTPLRRVQSLTAERRRLIRTRLVTAPREDHARAIQKIAASGHCTNKNGKGFLATFDWYIASDGPRIKALEGVYDDPPDRRQTAARQRAAAVEAGADPWSAVLRIIEGLVSTHDFYQWFITTTLVEDRGAELVIAASDLHASWITKHFRSTVDTALAMVRPGATIRWQDQRARTA